MLVKNINSLKLDMPGFKLPEVVKITKGFSDKLNSAELPIINQGIQLREITAVNPSANYSSVGQAQINELNAFRQFAEQMQAIPVACAQYSNSAGVAIGSGLASMNGMFANIGNFFRSIFFKLATIF